MQAILFAVFQLFNSVQYNPIQFCLQHTEYLK